MWIRVTIVDGNEGWASLKYLQQTTHDSAIALKDYSAQELDAVAGERVEILHCLDGWVCCENDSGQQGWLPKDVLTTA